MRQLKLANGLLVGNKIQLYYDGQLNKEESPILLKSIEISELDENGSLFIELFQKSTFSYQNLENFAEKRLKEITAESHKVKLHNLLISSDYQLKIQQFIVNDLQQNWDSDTIDEVLEQLSISIVPKTFEPSESTSATVPSFHHPEIQSSQPSGECVKIGDFSIPTYKCSTEKVQGYVKNIMHILLHNKLIQDPEMKNLQDKKYCRQVFKLSFPLIINIDEGHKDHKGRGRYWAKEVFGGKYYVCSQWQKNYHQASLEGIRKWLLTLQNQ